MALLFSCFPHPLSDATNNGPPPSEMGAKPSGHTKTLLVRQGREEAYQRIIKTLFQRMAADMPTAIFFPERGMAGMLSDISIIRLFRSRTYFFNGDFDERTDGNPFLSMWEEKGD